MERLRPHVQRREAPLAFALAAAAMVGAVATAPAAHAQGGPPAPPTAAEGGSPAEIVAARELFRQGTEDADAGRFAEGLEKFRRVAAVKETPAVRFNIARCEEALGRAGAALADFELAEREGRLDPKAEDVAKLAQGRADALRSRVPRLALTAPSPAPDGMSVSLDGTKLAAASLGAPLPVDPGSHVVEATAPGRVPFHADVAVAVGESKEVSIDLSPQDPAAVAADQSMVASAQLATSTQRTWGWVTIAAGGALAIGSGIFVVLHNNAVTAVNGDCPSERCPASQQGQIDSTQSDARTDEAVSIVFGAAAVLAVGGGVALLLTAPKAPSQPAVSLVPGGPAGAAGLTLRGSF